MAEGGGAAGRVWDYPARSLHPDAEIFVYDEWCKSCGICYTFCPRNVFTCDKSGRPIVSSPDDCIACGLCELMCPEMAITVYKKRGPKSGG